MNVKQRMAYMEAHDAAHKLGHAVTEGGMLGRYTVRCTCGWSSGTTKRNALARTAALDSLARKHYEDAVTRNHHKCKSCGRTFTTDSLCVWCRKKTS